MWVLYSTLYSYVGPRTVVTGRGARAHNTTHNSKQLQPIGMVHKPLLPSAHAQRSLRLATCVPVSVAIDTSKSHCAPRGLVACARRRSCQPFAPVLPGAQQHQVEVVVGLAAARDVALSAARRRAVP